MVKDKKSIYISICNFSRFFAATLLKRWFVLYSFRTCRPWLQKRVEQQLLSNSPASSQVFRNCVAASPCILALIGWNATFHTLPSGCWVLACVCVLGEPSLHKTWTSFLHVQSPWSIHLCTFGRSCHFPAGTSISPTTGKSMIFGEYTLLHVFASVVPCCQKGRQRILVHAGRSCYPVSEWYFLPSCYRNSTQICKLHYS